MKAAVQALVGNIMVKIRPVILCGGAGTRLWPASRGDRAKQFLRLASPDLTLLQQTRARVNDEQRFAQPMVICGLAHVAQVSDQLGDDARLIVEPMARNTAPAVALAVALAAPDEALLVMPSDHVIADEPAFHAAIAAALPLLDQDWLVTFGIAADRPETGYGYIERGAALEPGTFAVQRFVEKPDADNAARMLAQGGFDWNAGIFLFRASAMAKAMAQHCPAVWAAAQSAVAASAASETTVTADADAFGQAPSIAIDYAVMEPHDRVAVVPVSMGWTDLGSWESVRQQQARDESGNALRGDVVALDSNGCIVDAGGKRISLLGLSGIGVIVDGDDIAIFPLDRSQDVKDLKAARDG